MILLSFWEKLLKSEELWCPKSKTLLHSDSCLNKVPALAWNISSSGVLKLFLFCCRHHCYTQGYSIIWHYFTIRNFTELQINSQKYISLQNIRGENPGSNYRVPERHPDSWMNATKISWITFHTQKNRQNILWDFPD